MSDWLELELAHQLRPVEAPASLRCPELVPQRPRRQLAPFLAFAAAAAVLLLAIPKATAIRSTDPAAINRWIYACAGIDLPIPAMARGRVQGARMVERNGVRIAEITWRDGNRDLMLRIAPAAAADRDAHFKRHGAYAISSPEPIAGCGLCHVSL